MSTCLQWTPLLALAPDEMVEPGLAQTLTAHLETCPGCRVTQTAFAELRTATRRNATRHAPPHGLHARITAALVSQDSETPAAHRPAGAGRGFWISLAGGWMAAGALACALAVSLFLGPLPWTAKPPAPQFALADMAATYVDNHARALVTQHLIDVASSDRHTVKPWFRGRLDFSPAVTDLAAQGYPLLGGRLDYVAQRSVAVLVYQRRQHVIDVYEWPADGASAAAPVAEGRGDSRGYLGVAGNAGGMAFVAVSDLDPVELGDMARLFAQSLKAQAAGGTPQ